MCWPDTRLGVPADDALDVALLWLDEPVATDGGPVWWGQPSGIAPVPFEGAGFPAFASQPGSGAQVEYLRGELPVVSTTSSGWVLDCPVWPAAPADGRRPWAGASGSAVFCHGRLVGVVVEDDRAMDWRRIHAVPLYEALRLPGFVDLVTRHGHPGTTGTIDEVTARRGDAASDGAASVDDPATPWPMEVGPVPNLASSFQPRSDLREQVDRVRAGGGPAALTQVLCGGGGVGKTQLAAAFAVTALAEGADLVVWATATDLQRVITQYAQAAVRSRLPGASGDDDEADARILLDWLATTTRRWLVVLDDVTAPADLDGWWPASRTGTGWVLATTRLKDARLTGGGRTRIDVDVYGPDEAEAYVRSRLRGDGMDHLLDDRVSALAEALGRLPLALSYAAAFLINEELTCTAYLARYADRRTHLEQVLPESADTEGYGYRITAALLLSLDAVEAADPAGYVVTVLRVAALLDPDGHPHSLWTVPPLLDLLTTHHRAFEARAEARAEELPQATADQAHAALRLLHRYALIVCDTRAEPSAVRIHALTARAVRETMPEPELALLTRAAADGLYRIWPEVDQPHRELAAVLRANTGALVDHANDHLWQPDAHQTLSRAGTSLIDAGLSSAATAFWQDMTRDSERLLGSDHPETLTIRANLAVALSLEDRAEEALAIEEEVLAVRERVLGEDHPDTLMSRGNIAVSYQQLGRADEAVTLLERVVTDSRRLHGPDDPAALTDRGNLAFAYNAAGRAEEAIELAAEVLADRERVLGQDHPDTLLSRSNLAVIYRDAGRVTEAVPLMERVVADSRRILGDEHPYTLADRGNLGIVLRKTGRIAEAIALTEQVLADRERLRSNPQHILNTRISLAISYEQAGRTTEALALEERVLADSRQLLGEDHPATLTARGNVASSYLALGRPEEAAEIEEGLLADRLRVSGENHPHTLIARANLAASYQRAGRLAEAIALQEDVVAANERLLPADDPGVFFDLGNLAVSYRMAHRTPEAVELAERVLAGRRRVLGENHKDTVRARADLARSYVQARRIEEAVALLEQAVAGSERLVGLDHPETGTLRTEFESLREQLAATTDPKHAPEEPSDVPGDHGP
ncbi:tetratricopeptide repeat protein [Streptomyces wedmorensis]